MSDDWQLATREQIEAWRAMTPAQKRRLSGELSARHRDQIVRDVHREHPDWSQTRIDAEIMARLHPDDITPEACRSFALRRAMSGLRWPGLPS